MLQNYGILIQRVCGQIDTYQIALPVQTVEVAPTFRYRYFRSGDIHHILTAEQGVCSRSLVGLVTVTIPHQGFEEDLVLGVYGKILLSLQLREAVEPARQSKTFQVLLVAGCQIDTLHKIKYTFERTILLAFLHDALHSTLAYPFHRTKAKTDIAFLVHGELQVTFIHIRSQCIDAHCLAFVHQFGYIGNIRQTSAHDRRHVFGRIIGLEESRLIGHPRIASGM